MQHHVEGIIREPKPSAASLPKASACLLPPAPARGVPQPPALRCAAPMLPRALGARCLQEELEGGTGGRHLPSRCPLSSRSFFNPNHYKPRTVALLRTNKPAQARHVPCHGAEGLGGFSWGGSPVSFPSSPPVLPCPGASPRRLG